MAAGGQGGGGAPRGGALVAGGARGGGRGPPSAGGVVGRVDPERGGAARVGGRRGPGLWVVAIVGRTVIWYNDIEEGFNRSRYSAYGTIDDYWCNQDELELTVQYLMNALDQGADLVRLPRKPFNVPR